MKVYCRGPFTFHCEMRGRALVYDICHYGTLAICGFDAISGDEESALQTLLARYSHQVREQSKIQREVTQR